ncbi:hypothetical protein QJS10_CPA09g01206 [Acorus calamus]|uniref:CRM domain-containing protein n=1 Tax=Acorus calamus TaxID=4465 RepID=A0AAV9E7P4_ACOCL|nr:hypothetical protein QJS10_CPA09g01206 [Acorus calamus]
MASPVHLKLLSWRRLLHHPPLQTLIPSLSRFINHSPSDEPYDPPFSPVRKILTAPNKNHKKHVSTPSKTLTTDGVPVRSDLPFDFRYSYSETDPSVAPIGFREPPRFSPFGPGRLDRKWNGVSAPVEGGGGVGGAAGDRDSVLGEPLTEDEIEELVERFRWNDCTRQINLGKGGVTHNLLDDIHNHWKRAEAVRIKCLGVPTLDMDNICFHLEDKTGGKVIFRQCNIILLYRGRNYDPKKRPAIPLMLWKPRAPIYPRLVKNVIDGLTEEETKELRNRGLNSLALMKLSRNGVYVNVVEKVREAFTTDEVVRLDCMHVETSDCKKIGVKLRDLVPCVPILFKDNQIILWRGRRSQEDLVSQSDS